MKTFSLEGRPFIALNNLLKIEGMAESGASAKQAVADGQVLVNGAVELRKRCKITAGQVVEFDGQKIAVVE
ncbi:MAG: ribosome-associated protein YbcJ [Porticoccaceae bacterium]|jgi:ribosome-associated protein|nr:ribosome-associated protein YbcJ [Porticoccaceae bacterium]